MNCEKCGAEITAAETRDHAGQKICEDCYLDLVAQPKTCDPWAVYMAKNEMGSRAELTELQQKILELLNSQGPLMAQQVCDQLAITESQFQSNITSLRYMELARAFPRNGQIFYTLFDDQGGRDA